MYSAGAVQISYFIMPPTSSRGRDDTRIHMPPGAVLSRDAMTVFKMNAPDEHEASGTIKYIWSLSLRMATPPIMLVSRISLDQEFNIIHSRIHLACHKLPQQPGYALPQTDFIHSYENCRVFVDGVRLRDAWVHGIFYELVSWPHCLTFRGPNSCAAMLVSPSWQGRRLWIAFAD